MASPEIPDTSPIVPNVQTVPSVPVRTSPAACPLAQSTALNGIPNVCNSNHMLTSPDVAVPSTSIVPPADVYHSGV